MGAYERNNRYVVDAKVKGKRRDCSDRQRAVGFLYAG